MKYGKFHLKSSIESYPLFSFFLFEFEANLLQKHSMVITIFHCNGEMPPGNGFTFT